MSAVPINIWDEANQRVGLDEPPGPPLRLPIQSRRRRSYTADMSDSRAHLHLVDDDGMRRWIYEPPAAEQLRRRASRTHIARSGDVLRSFSYFDSRHAERGHNQVTQALTALDARLTPHQGLRRWDGQRFVPDASPALQGKTLLLVHGTFSHGDMFLTQWNAKPEGQQLWKDLRSRYKNILAFDHPTLSVAPWINALDLHAALRHVSGRIDVLSHSRGGLVVSWWLRLAPSRADRVIFVGSPLDGTSLASPYRLRAALDHLATIADLLAAGGQALATVAPIAAGAAGLAKIFGRALKLGSSLPLVDAAVAMVPGLASQQRTHDNAEMRCLFAEKWLTTPTFSTVAANFEPSTDQQSLWRVWERLKNAAALVAAGTADMVFDGPNDLVVDTAAMNFLGQHQAVKPADFLDLGNTNTYHTTYFQDTKVTGFLDQRLR